MTDNQNTLLSQRKRTAIDHSGRLGSLYDGVHDCALETLNVTCEKSSDRFPQNTRCVIEKSNQNQEQGLLELINIDEQLRLSLLLNLTPKHGLGAVINYPCIINQYTRIFHYTYIHREEEFPDNIPTIRASLRTIESETKATHLITGVSWGIDIVIILQLPSNDNVVEMIDNTLEKYRAYLNGDCNDFKLTRDDINTYTNIVDTKIYSNILISRENSTLHDIFHSITQRRMNESEHQQISYTLCPLQWFYSQSSTSNYSYIPLDLIKSIKLEQYLLDLLISLKTLETYFNEDMTNLLCGHFKERLANTYKRWFEMKNEYNNLIERFSTLIIEIRTGSTSISALNEELHNEQQIKIKHDIYNLTRDVSDLNAKGHLISDLGHQQIQYCNVIERHVDENDNEDELKRKLIVDKNSDRVLCSNDVLNKSNPEQLKKLRHALVEELERNSKLRLTYADFSYCTFELPSMIILPFSKYYIKKQSKQQELLSTSDITSSVSSMSTTHISVSPTAPLSTNETINILLLGETGVGKSTFINAFANYITFNTFDKMHVEQPIVAIPVSFAITAGENSEEYSVKFGDTRNSKNENFDHPGQSVTQHCKSYIIHPNHIDKRKLRIIDTPGFGDTRGLNQDDLHMQHIFEYIKRLSHLNAICILLKSNELTLNVFLQSCLKQLYDFFGSHVRRNIIFCFTNTRSTLYTPGHADTLLKEMFSSLPFRKIPLKKKNTFCFDNESFRYLIALQNRISFSNRNKQEYETSWTNSVMEVNRLIRYIRKNLIAFPIPNEWEAIKRAQIEIVQMIHPLLETIRHIFRKIILRKINSSKVSIELHSNDVHSHEKQNDSYQGQPPPNQPIPLDFLQEFKIFNCPLSQKQDEMIDQLSLLYHVSAEFGYFLAYFTPYPNGNPFLNGLFRLMTEEKNICDDYTRTYMNMQLVEGLKALAKVYEKRMKNYKTDAKRSNLTDIHEWIKYMHEYPLVSDYVIGNNRTNMNFDNDTISM